MYVDGKEWPMEGGPRNAAVRPNEAIEKATGLFVGKDPWLSDLEDVNFPCCGTIQFSIPGEGPLTDSNMISQKRDARRLHQKKNVSSLVLK